MMILAMPSDLRHIEWVERREEAYAKYSRRCVYCDDDADVIDHVLPESKGGTSEIENLRPACTRCNIEKGGRDFWEWFQDLLSDRREFRSRLDDIQSIVKLPILPSRKRGRSKNG